MSKIHTALKESAGTKHIILPLRQKKPRSSLDKKLIAAGIAPEILAEAHKT